MYCPKCGLKMEDTANFCNSCGSNLNKNSNQYNDNLNYGYISEEDLKKAYVGNNYERIKESKFSIPTFFLGIYYLLYRKMWLYAFLWIVILIASIILTIVYEIGYIALIPWSFSILLAFNFSHLYFQIVDRKIEKIKQRHSDKSKQELLEECRKKGGVSILAVILSILFIFIVSIFILFGAIADAITEEISKSKNINVPTSSELSYTIPRIFEDKNYNSDLYQSYNYNGDTDSCSISISSYKIYSGRSEEDYLKSSVIANMDDQVSEILAKEINGNTWKYVEVKSADKIVYYYASIYNDKIYQIKYTIYQDDHKLCSEGYNNFINSLVFQNINTGADTI